MCLCGSSDIWSVDQYCVNTDCNFNSCFKCCVSLLPLPELPYPSVVSSLLLLCSHLWSGFWLLWWPNSLVISASWLQTAVICLSGALQGRNVLFSLFFVFLICSYSLDSLLCGFLFHISPLMFLCCFKRDLLKTHAVRRSGRRTRNERNTEVRQCNEKHWDKKTREKEKSSGVPVSLQSGGVWLNVMLRAHQEIGIVRVAPCLNPTDRSPCLTGDGNQ